MDAHRDDGGGRDEPHPSARLSDAEIRAIAQQLVREHQEPPAPRPGERLSSPQHELAAADEERVAEAVAALGAADPAGTMRADRESASEPEPRPASWAFDGRTPATAADH